MTGGISRPHRETVLDRIVSLLPSGTILSVPKVKSLYDPLSLEQPNVNIGDAKLYCEQKGEGPPIVLINGGPGGTLLSFRPHFSHAEKFANIIYYDQRGCGRSDYEPGAGYSVEQAVDDLDKLRQALNIEKWVVLGHSYGGALARLYAEKYPERTLGIVLVSADYIGLPIQNWMMETRQDAFISDEEKNRIDEIFHSSGLSVPQKVFNAEMNGRWKLQSFNKPSIKDMARKALHGWKQDEKFREAMINSIMALNAAVNSG